MKARKITARVDWVGAVDWNRRLFDSLIPLPDGTSYNAYLVWGSNKTALIDTADPAMSGVLMKQLENVKAIDYVVAQHVEQDQHPLALLCREFRRKIGREQPQVRMLERRAEELLILLAHSGRLMARQSWQRDRSSS